MNIDVSSLNSLGELNEALKSLDKYEQTFKSSLDDILNQKQHLDKSLLDLQEPLKNINVLNSDAHSLGYMINCAGDIGIKLSGNVRQLDLAKNRVLCTESLITNIIQLIKCADITSAAIDSKNIMGAVKSISNFLKMGTETRNLVKILEHEDVGVVILDKLHLLHQQVIKLLSSSFDSAADSSDLSEVERLFPLFPLVKEDDVGLLMLANFLSKKITLDADTQFSLLKSESINISKQSTYVYILTKLLEATAYSIQSHEAAIKEHYRDGSLFEFIQILQNACDSKATLIIIHFKQNRELSIAVEQARHQLTVGSKSTIATGQLTSIFDHCLASEDLISELISLNARIELYLNFIRRRLSTVQSEKTVAASISGNKIKQFFNNCELCKLSHELIGSYLPHEQLFLRELVNKAIQKDEVDETSGTFRFVDDVFFVVKKCLSRSISSGSVDAVCAMFNHCNAVISDQVINDSLLSRVKNGFPSGWMQHAFNLVHKRAGSGSLKPSILSNVNIQGSSENPSSNSTKFSTDGQLQYLFTLNSLEACVNCLQILKTALNQLINSVFDLRSTKELGKLQACLSDLENSLSTAFQNLINVGFEHLQSVIRPQINSITQQFGTMKRELTEDEFEQYSVNDPCVESMIIALQSLLQQFNAVLSPSGYEKFLSIVIDEMVLRLERFVQQKTYNRYGALQFDKELRHLFNFFTSLSNLPCRDKFTRLLQISRLLNVENVEEVSYYGNTSNWRLSANEIRRLLTLRIDFRAEDIRRLQL